MNQFTEDILKGKGFSKNANGVWKKTGEVTLQTEVKSENKKVRNATKCAADGFKFDSKIELFQYRLLKKFDIKFELKKKFVLQEGFIYMGEKIKPITWSPDFVIDSKIVIDTKGLVTEPFQIRLKMFKKLAALRGDTYEFHFPTDERECFSVVLKLTGKIL